jgi:hypothetical protein
LAPRSSGRGDIELTKEQLERNTWIVQHIYGAIQEYGGFEEPAWLD